MCGLGIACSFKSGEIYTELCCEFCCELWVNF
jgi:hypothetical protein